MGKPKEELFDIRGGVPDPAGTGLRGLSAGVNFSAGAIAHPAFRWEDRLSRGDLHRGPDGSLMFHFFCPRCTESCKVDSHRKQIGYEPGRTMSVGGETVEVISIETFTCNWCGLCIEVDRGIARDRGSVGRIHVGLGGT